MIITCSECDGANNVSCPQCGGDSIIILTKCEECSTPLDEDGLCPICDGDLAELVARIDDDDLMYYI